MVQFSDLNIDERVNERKQAVPSFDHHEVNRLLNERHGGAPLWASLHSSEQAAVRSGEERQEGSTAVREAGGNCGEDEDVINGLVHTIREEDPPALSGLVGKWGQNGNPALLPAMGAAGGPPDRLRPQGHLSFSAPLPAKPISKPTPIAVVRMPYRFYIIETARGIDVSANQGTVDQNQRRQEKYAERVAERGGNIREMVDLDMVFRRTDKQPKRDQMLRNKKGEVREGFLGRLPEEERARLRKLAEAPLPPRTPREGGGVPGGSPPRRETLLRKKSGVPGQQPAEGGLEGFSLDPPLQQSRAAEGLGPPLNGAPAGGAPDVSGMNWGPGVARSLPPSHAGGEGPRLPRQEFAVQGAPSPETERHQQSKASNVPLSQWVPSAAAGQETVSSVSKTHQDKLPQVLGSIHRPVAASVASTSGGRAEPHVQGASAPPAAMQRPPLPTPHLDAHPGMMHNAFYQSKKKRSKTRKHELQERGLLPRTAPMTYLLKLKRSLTDHSHWELIPPQPAAQPPADVAGQTSSSEKSSTALPLRKEAPRGGAFWEQQPRKKVRSKGKKKQRAVDPETGLLLSQARKAPPQEYGEGEPRRKVGRPPRRRSASPGDDVSVGVLALGAVEGPDDESEERYEDLEGPCSARLVLKEGSEGEAVSVEERVVPGGGQLVFLKGGAVVKIYVPERFNPEARMNPATGALIWTASEKADGPQWSLVFDERIEWHRFKDLHDQALVIVRKAARSKKIPIPGVAEVEDYEANYPPVPHLREGEAYLQCREEAFSLTRHRETVLYDADSEDEAWLAEVNRRTALDPQPEDDPTAEDVARAEGEAASVEEGTPGAAKEQALTAEGREQLELGREKREGQERTGPDGAEQSRGGGMGPVESGAAGAAAVGSALEEKVEGLEEPGELEAGGLQPGGKMLASGEAGTEGQVTDALAAGGPVKSELEAEKQVSEAQLTAGQGLQGEELRSGGGPGGGGELAAVAEVEDDWEALSLQPCSQALDLDTMERIVDKLEKAAAQAGRVVSKQEGLKACEGLAPRSAIRAVYAQWRARRKRRGMPLIRYFQPTPWSRYQQLVKEWQESEASRRATCQREGRPFVATKKPPLDAFSLRPTSYSKEQRRLQRKTGNSPGRPKASLKRKKAVRTKPSAASRLGPLWSPQYRPLGAVHTATPGGEFAPERTAFTGGQAGEEADFMDGEGPGFGDYLAHEATRKRSALGPLGAAKRSRFAGQYTPQQSQNMLDDPWSLGALSGSSAHDLARNIDVPAGNKARTAAARAAKAAKQTGSRGALGKPPRQMLADGRRARKRKRVQMYSPKKETHAQIAERAVKRAQELHTRSQFLAAVADAAMVRASKAIAECQELYEKEVGARTAQSASQASSVRKGRPAASVVSGERSTPAKASRGRPKVKKAAAVPAEVEGARKGRPKELQLDLDSEVDSDDFEASLEGRRPHRGLVRPITAVDIGSVEESAGIRSPESFADMQVEGRNPLLEEAHPAYSLDGLEGPGLSVDMGSLLERERQLWKLKRVWGQDVGQQGLKMWPPEEIEAGGRLASKAARDRDWGEGPSRGRSLGSRKAKPSKSMSILSLEEDEDDLDFDPVNGPFFEGYKVSRPRPRDLRVDVEGLDNRLEGGFTPQTLASVNRGAGAGLLASPKGGRPRKKSRATPRQ